MNKHQGGVFLLEALIAILIFSIGILGMIAMGATAIAAQSDAQYRTEAANYANEITSHIWVNIDRTNSTTAAASLAAFQHQPSGSCDASPYFSGTPSADAAVTTWVSKVTGVADAKRGLPGATAAMQQILVDTTSSSYNRVTVTVCWQASADRAPRKHSLTTYIN